MMDKQPPLVSPPHTALQLVSGHCPPSAPEGRQSRGSQPVRQGDMFTPSDQTQHKTTLHTDFISTDKFGRGGGGAAGEMMLKCDSFLVVMQMQKQITEA